MKAISKILCVSALATIFLAIACQPAFGGDSNARALGMGGAYISLARAHEAADWNPANLGLHERGSYSIGILSLGVRTNNNSFSLADYNKYNGSYLDDDDKNDILNSIPSDGLNINAGAEVSALNFSIGNFALTYKAYGVSDIYLGRDPFQLLLLGNTVMREVSLSGTRSEAYAFGDITLSYGRAVRKWVGGELAIGGSLHYLKGLAYEKVIGANGGVATTDTGFAGHGSVKVHSSLGGSGYSSDIGLALRFEQNWYYSIVWQNSLSKVNWSRDTKESVLSFNMKPLTIENMAGDDRGSLVSNADTTYMIDGFSSSLAPSMKMGLARKCRGVTWSVEWDQAFFNGPLGGINPRISGGIEYNPWAFLPLRTGMAFGGSQGSLYSLGFGLCAGAYHFDFGIANNGSPLPFNSRGLKMAFGMQLYF